MSQIICNFLRWELRVGLGNACRSAVAGRSHQASLRAPIERFATLTWRTRRGGTELSETTPISLPLTDRAASARVMDSPSLSEGSFIIVDRDSEQSQSLPGPFPPKDTHPDASVVHYFHRS